MNMAGSIADNSTNGTHSGTKSLDSEQTDTQILHALELIHSPRSQNEVRQNASHFLEQIKAQDEAPYHGYVLASNKSHPATVRHYGLSLLEYAIQHRWPDYSEDQSTALREWILKLAHSVTGEDALYVRNKIALLWVEIAKRSWAVEWMDMDELLVQLWNDTIAQKELVLVVLETLSENVFGREDTTAGLRGHDLSKACVEIFTPADVLTEQFPARDISVNVRYGEEGWLTRISDLLGWCNGEGQSSDIVQGCALKALSTLKSVIGWAVLKALAATHCVPRICESLTGTNQATRLAAVETLYILYNRPRFHDDNIRDLVCPMYEQESIHLLRRVYEWSIVNENNIEDDKYLLSKKFSETIYNIGRFLEEKPSLICAQSDVTNFLDLLLAILKNQSLHVSIPILHLWVKLLKSETMGKAPPLINLIGPLLEICSQRLIKYEALPEDSSLPSMIFLSEDVDTMPERHAFLGNYARFCNDIVENIVQKKPFDALYHILGQADEVLNHLYDGEPSFQIWTYTKSSVPLLRLDAQFSVVEAALKGYARWLTTSDSQQSGPEQDVMNSNLETWSTRLMNLIFEDPLIKQRVIQVTIEFAVGPLKRNSAFIFKVFEFVLNTRVYNEPHATVYNDAGKELQIFCVHQLYRLAMRASDFLITIYDGIGSRINEICRETALDEHSRERYTAVLFVLTHRAKEIDATERELRLERFVQPIARKWSSTDLTVSLTSFEGFCSLLGLGEIQEYFKSRAVQQIAEWSAHPLDDDGRALQVQMHNAVESLPLRTTKTFLSVSVEKMDFKSQPFQLACVLWAKLMPSILPNLLRLISYAHSFHDSSQWTSLPLEMRGIVGRVLTDRFWQVGISSGSRDEFYAKVGGTKTSLEGLASSIRATLRLIRETGYRLLVYISMLGEQLYMYPELPGPLSKALFADAYALSTHQTAILVETTRPIIENCPSAFRASFIPPMLVSLFIQLDRKVSSEWDKLEHRSKAASEDNDLAEEMRDESILRQLTFTSVMLVVSLLDPNKSNQVVQLIDETSGQDGSTKSGHGSMRSFILNTPETLKPVILFCTHALRMHDGRSCGFITRVLRSLIPEFKDNRPISADVREFISTEVFKACITSLHDPYFVDTQGDLAQLIASIISTYSSRTDTPRQILLSLPEVAPEAVDRAIHQCSRADKNHRQQRAVVLKLLEGLRGLSIGEQGRVAKPDPKKARSAMQERYMTVDVQANLPEEPSPDLEGVADMFGE